LSNLFVMSLSVAKPKSSFCSGSLRLRQVDVTVGRGLETAQRPKPAKRGIATIAAIPIPADSTVAATCRRKKALGTYTLSAESI
jgi:hypothetical protein